jgi:hypothetical protein
MMDCRKALIKQQLFRKQLLTGSANKDQKEVATKKHGEPINRERCESNSTKLQQIKQGILSYALAAQETDFTNK